MTSALPQLEIFPALEDAPSGRTCTQCGVWKPAADFYFNHQRKQLFPRCKVCTLAMNADRRANNLPVYQAIERDSKAKTRNKMSDRIRVQARTSRVKKFGLEFDAVVRMLEDQGGVCPICEMQISFTGSWRGKRDIACLDHDHETGNLRGVLCQNCNSGLGLFLDNKLSLLRAVRYLEEASNR